MYDPGGPESGCQKPRFWTPVKSAVNRTIGPPPASEGTRLIAPITVAPSTTLLVGPFGANTTRCPSSVTAAYIDELPPGSRPTAWVALKPPGPNAAPTPAWN